MSTTTSIVGHRISSRLRLCAASAAIGVAAAAGARGGWPRWSCCGRPVASGGMQPRRHRMRQRPRRDSARAWIASGATVTVKAYAKRYGVDRYTAFDDLAALGFPSAGLRAAVGAASAVDATAAVPASGRPRDRPRRRLVDHPGRQAVLRRRLHPWRGTVRNLHRRDPLGRGLDLTSEHVGWCPLVGIRLAGAPGPSLVMPARPCWSSTYVVTHGLTWPPTPFPTSSTPPPTCWTGRRLPCGGGSTSPGGRGGRRTRGSSAGAGGAARRTGSSPGLSQRRSSRARSSVSSSMQAVARPPRSARVTGRGAPAVRYERPGGLPDELRGRRRPGGDRVDVRDRGRGWCCGGDRRREEGVDAVPQRPGRRHVARRLTRRRW